MSSDYCTLANVQDAWGIGNVAKWSDLENNGELDSDRVDRGISWASDYIDDVFRTLQWITPIITPAAETPTTIRDLCSQLVGWWLYRPRGSEDFDPRTGAPGHRLSWAKIDADELLAQFATSRRKLPIV
jgi:hypothetical protein